MQNVLVLILGGGRGARLFPLTKHRSEPAVPIAGKYRLIDIPISNCVNSGTSRIYVLTQYMSVSLHRHITTTYKFAPFSHAFVEVLAAQQTNERAEWFKGTADAIRQNIRYLETDPGEDVLILYGDQLYRVDLMEILNHHRSTNADVTMAVTPVQRNLASNYGIARVDDAGRIVQLVEKPSTEQHLRSLVTKPEYLKANGCSPERGEYLANMGMYFFKRESLMKLLKDHPNADDIVVQILSGCLQTYKAQSYLFKDYWEDVGSIKAYFDANIRLTRDNPPFNFHVPESVIYTRMRNLPASRILNAKVEHCLISDGCLVEHQADLQNCVLGVRSHICKNVKMRDVVMMGANYFDDQAPRFVGHENPPILGVGEGSYLERVILDKNVRIGKNVQIINRDKKAHFDGDNYYIREGIVIVPNSAVIPDGTVI